MKRDGNSAALLQPGCEAVASDGSADLGHARQEPHLMGRDPRSVSATEAQGAGGRPRDYHQGYKPVLMRWDVKEQLWKFRQKHNFKDSHFERCLVSAAIQVLMGNPGLYEQWISATAAMASEDVMLQSGLKNLDVRGGSVRAPHER